jgi:peptide/nickel transport system substrate-binding protein
MYNNKKAPTDDENFRRALNCLYDYEMISTNILVDSPQANGPVSTNTPGAYQNNAKFKFDIEKAKEYLQKSKYADKLDEYPVELLVNTDVADHEKIALALQASAQQIGIKVNISKAPWISIQEQVAKVDTTPNVVCISVAPHFMEAGSMLLSRYHSSSVGTWEQGEWLENDDIDSMIENALATVDNNERYKKYEDIQKILVNEIVPSGWLVDLVQRHAYRSDYVYWPIAELSKSGEIPTLSVGYAFDCSQIKVYPERK